MRGRLDLAVTGVQPPAGQRHPARTLLLVFVAAWAALGFWNSVKPLPAGTHVASLTTRMAESDVQFLYDAGTHRDILPHLFAVIDRAEQLVVLDFFLFNDFPTVTGALPAGGPARELTRHLLARKKAHPNLAIVVITDPVNELYGSAPSPYLGELERAGVVVVRTRLDALRDSNPLYSGLWRLLLGWWADDLPGRGWLDNRFDVGPRRISLRAWLRLASYKADHRGVLAADDGEGGWRSIVTSAGPNDADAANGNVALELRGRLAGPILESELQIAGWSVDDDRLPLRPAIEGGSIGSIDARFLTEGAVRAALLDAVGAAGAGDEICMAASYVAERPLVDALLSAAARGVHVRLLLDANRAVDPTQDGLPNQAVAGELVKEGEGRIEIRWMDGGDARFHAEMILIQHRADLWLSLGSADGTRQSLDDLNLEADVELRMPARGAPARAAAEYFEEQWTAAEAYERRADESPAKYWRYRILEATGMAGF